MAIAAAVAVAVFYTNDPITQDITVDGDFWLDRVQHPCQARAAVTRPRDAVHKYVADSDALATHGIMDRPRGSFEAQ
jgi:hypothetical protein